MTAVRPTSMCFARVRNAWLGWLASAAGSVVLAIAAPGEAATLDDVKARGHLVCGVSEGMPGFAELNERGSWTGFDIDICAAVAAATLGRKDAVKYRVVTPASGLPALMSREVDLLPRSNARTLSRDTEYGVRYVETTFHEGQGFLVRRGYAVASVLELSGASVCVMAPSGAMQGLETYFQSRNMRYSVMASEQWADAVKAYADGACTLLTGDITALAAARSRFTTPTDHVILPELITKDKLGPVVRTGDEQWFSIVRWTIEALVAAEELGISQQNIDTLRGSANVDIRRLLGLEADLGRSLGLSRDWSYQVIKQVGNYGDVFDRNVGVSSRLRLDRGANNLWTKGGLFSAPPLR
ncbi:amino acid ABC transporter substrate-binding protein [Hyphomicrobium sp.]|uniref:amino acid ABC transporter substrate-binding protein n=1 Tax=Hyphomicrobium sp. TaxID=82 RepID=UPI003F720D78